jgi:ParB/RepB/Spo0J family partition protein
MTGTKAKTAMPDVVNVAIDKVVVDVNPRKDFDKNEMAGLQASIEKQGILQPLIVRVVNQEYHLVAGERRLRAAKAAGISTVPTITREMTDEQVLEVQLIENLQRADLAPLEEAKALVQLVDRGLSQREVAQLIGKSEGWVSGRIRMLDLPKTTQKLVTKGKVTVEQAVSMLPYAGTAVMEEMERNLSQHIETFGSASTNDVKEEVIGTALNNDEFVFRFDSRLRQFNQQELEAAFGLEDCDKCPDKREIPATWGDGTQEACLKKECWSKKLREAKKWVRTKHMEKNAKDRAKDERAGVLDLSKRHIDHKEFATEHYGRPKFDVHVCAGCEHHVKAKDQWKKTPYYICTEPSCYNEMDQAYTKAIHALRKGIAQTVAVNLNDRTTADATAAGPKKTLEPNELRFVLSKVLDNQFHDEKLKATFAPWVAKKPKRGWMNAILTVPDDELELVLFRYVVFDELQDIQRGDDVEIKTNLSALVGYLLKGIDTKLDVKVEPSGRQPEKGEEVTPVKTELHLPPKKGKKAAGISEAVAEAEEENEEAELGADDGEDDGEGDDER